MTRPAHTISSVASTHDTAKELTPHRIAWWRPRSGSGRPTISLEGSACRSGSIRTAVPGPDCALTIARTCSSSSTTASVTCATASLVITDPDHPTVSVPRRYEQAAIDAVERCPGECIYVEPDRPQPDTADDSDIVDAEIVDN